jgi:hypothetical protein
MTDRSNLANKEVLIKIIGVEFPIRTTIKEFGDSGIWIHDDSLRITLVSQTPLKGMPRALEPSPVVFLPLHRIEWMLARPTDVR